MRPPTRRSLGLALVGPSLLGACVAACLGADDPQPRGLGRLFRLGSGGSSTSGGGSNGPAASPVSSDPGDAALRAYGPATPSVGSGPAGFGSVGGRTTLPSSYSPLPSATPGSTAPAPRITPQPRNSRAVTESDPLVTRISLVRSDNGSQFGMFMQVFADGTVVDSEGVHKVAPEVLRPIVELIQSGELARVRGHCGAPPTDYVENVQFVVFERSLGRLRANAFSYSGNPQGCPHAVRHLHQALEAVQGKVSGLPTAPGEAPGSGPGNGSPPPGDLGLPGASVAAPPAVTAPPIPLSPNP